MQEDPTMTQTQLPPIAIDFETYYDKVYSLEKLDTILYVRDRRFEVIGFSYKIEGQAAEWFSGAMGDVACKLRSLELEKREVTAHHAMFDGAILEWVFNIKPLRYLCTMMGARPYVVPFMGSAALTNCARFWRLPPKGDFNVMVAKGCHREDFSVISLYQYGEYCRRDTELSWMIREKILPCLPQDELDLIDLTVKKFLRGRLLFDSDMLEEARGEVADRESKALLVLGKLNLTRQSVTSNPQFAEALIKRGVPAPMKISPATGEQAFAFSKKDPEFMALQQHPDKEVQLLVQARLLLKSSIDRTRLDKFLAVASCCPTVPVPLLYYGAHTGRFSGFMGINMQNLPKSSALRRSLRAPPGYRVIVADLKAIEARITAVLAGELELVEQFRMGVDVYSKFASVLYEKPAAEITEEERFVGKMCILGLGFGMGAAKFALTMASVGIQMTETRAQEIVTLYRSTYRGIKALWRRLDRVIGQMSTLPQAGGQTWFGGTIAEPLLKISREAVELPNGMLINYPGLGTMPGDPEHFMFESRRPNGTVCRDYIWGGGLTENIVQALARIILSRAEVRLARAGLVSVMQVHDELVFVVPEHLVPAIKGVIQKTLTDPVPWMPSLPLACSISDGASYGEAK